MTNIDDIRQCLLSNQSLSQEEVRRWFKTAPGSYAHHDRFLGVRVPDIRKIARLYQDVDLAVINILLKSTYNEERLLALFVLIRQYQKGDEDRRKHIYNFYLDKLKYVNNWNLVDASAHYILGHHLYDKDRSIIYHLAQSEQLWEKRIAIVATWYFIRQGDINTTFLVAKMLLKDSHDLIHKAVGWMLRETGKKNENALKAFLLKNMENMPKTMLRYAREKLTNK